jgi:hypothetical protein
MADIEDNRNSLKGCFSAYENETNRNLTRDSALRHLKSTDDLLVQIEVEGRAFHDWRNKHRRLWSSLSAFLAPVTAMNEIAFGAVSNYPPAAALLGSVLYLIKVRSQRVRCHGTNLKPFSHARRSPMLTTGRSKSLQSCRSFRTV